MSCLYRTGERRKKLTELVVVGGEGREPKEGQRKIKPQQEREEQFWTINVHPKWRKCIISPCSVQRRRTTTRDRHQGSQRAMENTATTTTKLLKLSTFSNRNIFTEEELERHAGTVTIRYHTTKMVLAPSKLLLLSLMWTTMTPPTQLVYRNFPSRFCRCGETEFSGNRLLLRLFSGYFRRALVNTDADVAATITVPSAALNCSAVLLALELIHSGQVKVKGNGSAAEEVIGAANWMEVDGLEGEDHSELTARGVMEALEEVSKSLEESDKTLGEARKIVDDSEADTDVAEEEEEDRTATPVNGSPEKEEVFFKSILGKIVVSPRVADATDDEMEETTNGDNDGGASPLAKSTSAADRILREISETLPVSSGDECKDGKGFESHSEVKATEKEEEEEERSPDPEALKTGEEATDEVMEAEEEDKEEEEEERRSDETPKTTRKRRRKSSVGSGGLSSSSRKRRYQLRLNVKANAARIGGSPLKCDLCGYWSYRKGDLRAHRAAAGHQ